MRERISGVLPYVALAAAAVLVVVLAQQKRGLITQVDTLRRQVYEARAQPTRGAYLPSFQTTTLDGAPVTVGAVPSPGRQVLLVYTTTCQFCKRTLPAWKSLTAALDSLRDPRVQVYGVSLDSVEVTRRYAAEHALPYPTIRFPDRKLESMYRAGTVPMTVVLDEEGRTIYSRLGEITKRETIDSVITWVKWKPAPADTATAAPAQARTASR